MNVSLQSINQPQLCEEMLEAMTRDDRDSLLIVTSTKKISVSSKMLQIFSLLYRDILRDIPIKDSEPVTMILPDTEAVHVQHLLDLLISGAVHDNHLSWGSAGDILTLAECFRINLIKIDYTSPLQDMDKNPLQRIRVKNLKEISSPIQVLVPFESLHNEKENSPTSPYVETEEVINIDDEEVVKSVNVKCSFCRKEIHKDKRKVHEEEDCLGLVRNCPICQKEISKGDFKNHEKVCRVRRKGLFRYCLFECHSCEKKFNTMQGLSDHVRMKH